MAFLKFLFYLQLYLVVRITELIFFIPKFILDLLLKASNFLIHMPKRSKLKNAPKRKVGRPKKLIKNKTISLNRPSIYVRLKFFGAKIVGFVLNIISLLSIVLGIFISESKGFLLFVLAFFSFPFIKFFNFFNQKKSKRKIIKKKFATQITFIHKFKYSIIGSLIALFLVFIPLLSFIFISELPDLSNINFDNIPKSTKILDRNGELLYEIYANQNRTIVPLSTIPKDLVNATIAIEDKDFYEHFGFDLSAMLRAFLSNIRSEKVQGGSTITQQLIKSALLSPEPTITRKVKEVVLAIWAERTYSKDQILEFYFNYIPYGGTAWGVEAASNVYFGKDVKSLSLAESSYLAGLPQAPGRYNPFAGNLEAGKIRQKEVLNAMVEQKYISQKQADEAYKQNIEFKSAKIQIKAPHFVMYVKDLLVQKYGIYDVEKGGLKVRTTLDLKAQEAAQKIVSDEVEKSRYLGVGNGSALVANPQNGEIYAMVGSRDYFDFEHDGNVNLTLAQRQPGSTIKVIPYTLALTEGFTEATILDDTPLTIQQTGSTPYTPVNYDGRYHGKVPLRLAFANSFNIPAVRIAQKLGVDAVVDFGEKMGITSWEDKDKYGVSIALGAAEVNMLDLTTAYGVIANKGEKVNLDPILEIRNTKNEDIYKREVQKERIIDPGVAFIVADILADNKARSMAFGPNTPLVIPNFKVSVKTGTTDNKRDNWTVGFTNNLIVSTWVGNNDNTPLSQALASGITGAAPMWNKIVLHMLQGKTQESIEIPSNVIPKRCFGYEAYFIRGTEVNQCFEKFPTISVSPTLPPVEIITEDNNTSEAKQNRNFWRKFFRNN